MDIDFLLEASENLELIFNTIPDAVIITRLTDGRLVHVNDGFVALTGYTRAEVIGKTTREINIWKSPEEREKLVNSIKETGVCENLESVFQRKDGSRIVGVISARLLVLKGVEHIIGVTRDITLHKQEEISLAESEARYQDLYENAPDMYLSVDPQTRKIIQCNQTTVRITGFEKHEIIGRPIFEMYHPDCLEMVKQAFRNFITTGEVHETELQVCCKNGSILDVVLNVTAVKDANGNIIQSRSSWRDITQRKKAEQALRNSEARFRSYFELPLIGIAITSLEKGWIETNQGVRDMLGYSMEELSGLSWAELTHPEDLAADEEQFRRVLSDQQDTYFLEKRFICKNKEIIWTHLSVGCVRKPDRSVDYMVALLENITKRKLAEEALRKSEEKFRSLYENMSEGSAMHTLVYNDQGVPEDYLIMEVNPAFEAQLGISRDIVINKTSRDAYGVDEPPFFEIYSRVAVTGIPESFETYYVPLEKYFSISVYSPYKGSFATIFNNCKR